ncbi:MAG: metal ABC transporter permease [Proteobacteria bacterium]|nr:metal ABC transporter permease [Pseudomonadota bacterium]
MTDFLSAVMDPDNGFLRLALYVATLSSISFGIIGTYVITRRISYLAGSISHCVFGGIGAGLFLKNRIGISWFDPMYGAIIAALLSAVIIGVVSLKMKQREDTVIGALWAVGMAAGLLFIDMTPGYFDMTSYLFGDILLLSKNDLFLVIGLDIIVAGFAIYYYNILLAVCFDDEFAYLRGIHAGAFYILLLCLTALTVVLLVRIVGIIMVIALLTIPAAVAGQFSRRLWQMMILSTFLCIFFSWTGLIISYSNNLSSGPTIIMVAAAVYFMVLLGARFFKRAS